MILRYKPRLKERARALRNNMTLPEVLLWQHLKGKQMRGYDFHRQKPIDGYIVDFFGPKLNLVIEVDGKYHQFTREYDARRQKRLEELGLIFLRIPAVDILHHMDDSLKRIELFVMELEKKLKV